MSVRFVIVCPARTGSTMLVSALQSHPGVLVQGEVFGDEVPRIVGQDLAPANHHALIRLRDLDPSCFLDDIVFSWPGYAALGCKFKYEEMLLARWRSVVRHIVDDPDIRIVSLRRENLLARFLSEYRATAVTHMFNTQDSGAVPTVQAHRLDPDACELSFSQTELREQRFRALFTAHPVLELTYEAMTSDLPGSIAHVQRFLDVDLTDVAPSTKKLRTSSLRDAIVNFDELRRHFAGSRYARYFEEDG